MRLCDLVVRCFLLLNVALGLGLLTGRLQSTEVDEQRAPIPTLTVQEAAKHLVAGDALFIDARPFTAYKSGFIPTAVSLPFGQTPSAELLGDLRKAKKIIAYCDGAGCRAAEEVASSLLQMKFSDIAVLSDGMRGWESAGMPVSKFPDS